MTVQSQSMHALGVKSRIGVCRCRATLRRGGVVAEAAGAPSPSAVELVPAAGSERSSVAVGKADGGADCAGQSSTTIGEADGGVDRPADVSPPLAGVGRSSTAIGMV